MLTFDDAKHEYRYNGAVVPHVTGVLAPLVDYSFVDPEDLKRAQDLGTRTHKLVELECANPIPLTQLDPFWQPYLLAWRAFVRETGFKLHFSERRVYHPAYNYAGTLDLEGELFGELGILDLKKSFAAGRAIGVQISAYEDARNAERRKERMKPLKVRYGVRLCPDNSVPYRLKKFDDPDDFGAFLGLLKVQRWKEKHP